MAHVVILSINSLFILWMYINCYLNWDSASLISSIVYNGIMFSKNQIIKMALITILMASWPQWRLNVFFFNCLWKLDYRNKWPKLNIVHKMYNRILHQAWWKTGTWKEPKDLFKKKATSVHLKTEAVEIPWAYHTEPIDTIMSLP